MYTDSAHLEDLRGATAKLLIEWPGERVGGKPQLLSAKPRGSRQTIDFVELFGNDRPLFVDIGCGKGRVLVEQPLGSEFNYLGIEKRRKYVNFTAERIIKRNIKNVRLLPGYAEEVLTAFPPSSVSRMSLLFPDPWHKDRHKKRRYIQGAFLDLLHQLFTKEGRIWIVSDHHEYFDFISSGFGAHQGFKALDEKPPEGLTHFEIKYTKQQRPIYRITYGVRK